MCAATVQAYTHTNESLRVAVQAFTADCARAEHIYGAIEAWDVSHVTNMAWLFEGQTAFSADLSRWDVANVVCMDGMFCGAHAFCSDLGSWNVASVRSMVNMFYAAESFVSDLSRWDTSRVTDMTGMFEHATSFESDLSRWDLGRLFRCADMFSGATPFALLLRSASDAPTQLTPATLRAYQARWRWARVRRTVRVLRPIVLFWMERAVQRSYGPGGIGRARDFVAFTNACSAIVSVPIPDVRGASECARFERCTRGVW